MLNGAAPLSLFLFTVIGITSQRAKNRMYLPLPTSMPASLIGRYESFAVFIFLLPLHILSSVVTELKVIPVLQIRCAEGTYPGVLGTEI
jgi:hypothetical protein